MGHQRANTTRLAVLGLLSIRSLSGYDIRQLAKRSIGHFWSESYGQIYPTLKQLEKELLVKSRMERLRGKPDRIVYSLTPNGLLELQRWIKLPARSETLRNELLLKLFFCRHAAPSNAIEHVTRHRETHRALLATYERIEQELRQQHARHPDLPFWLITLNFGKHHSEASLLWCEQTLASLTKTQKQVKRRSSNL